VGSDHVLLQEGHVWGRREVAIPISAVTGVEDRNPAEHHQARVAALLPFEREQRLREHRRWCAGICGNSLLQAAEADLQLVGTELSEERKSAQAQPFEHLTRVPEDGSVTMPKLATRQPTAVNVAMTSCSGWNSAASTSNPRGK